MDLKEIIILDDKNKLMPRGTWGGGGRVKDWWIYTVPLLLIVAIASHLIISSRPGAIGLILYLTVPMAVSALAVLFLLIGIISSIIKRPFFSKWRIAGFIGLLIFPLSYLFRMNQQGNFFSAYPSSHDNEVSKIEFQLPLDTPITVFWGGERAEENHHVAAPDQRWAYDLLVMKDKKSFQGDSTKLENYYCYGLPLLAPAAGQVVAVLDSFPDTEIGVENKVKPPHGNHVGSSRVDLQACKLEYSIVSPK